MPTVRDDDRRTHRGWTLGLALAALAPAAVLALALAIAGAEALYYTLLIPVLAFSVGIAGSIRGRVTRSSTDERARQLDRQARSFAFMVITLALFGVWAGTVASHGTRAAQPYLYLLVLLQVTYVVSLMWLRRRS